MKNSRIIFALFAALCTVGCGEDVPDNITPVTSEGRVTLEVSSESSMVTMNESGSAGDVLFLTRGGEIAIEVLTNQEEWAYEAVDAEWLTISADKYYLTLTASENKDKDSRTATVVIRASLGEQNAAVELHITQNHSGVAEIYLADDKLRFEAHTNLNKSIAVECNQDEWTFECTCEWLLIEQSAEGLILSADDNPYEVLRSAEITLLTGQGSNVASTILRVNQDGDAFVRLASHNIATDDSGGRKSLAVESNPELEWDFVSDGSDWFEVAKEEDNLIVAIDYNEIGLERSGTITINVGDENNSASATVKVFQIGTDTEELIYEVNITSPNFQHTAAPVLTTSSGGSITVDWGDGSEVETFEAKRGSHTYKKEGLYTITISGEAHQLQFGDGESECPEVKNIISWGLLGVKNAADMCLGCSGLESIPNDVAGSFANVKSFLGAFSCCESLKEIPAGLFRYATQAKNFEDCFSHSASISAIPEDLFANCPNAERFTYAFYGTGTGYVITTSTLPNFSEVKGQVLEGRLKEIPAGLFRNNTAVERFDYVFGATAIESIPEGLFDNNTAATNFEGAFSACVRLAEIPVALLSKATAATNIKYLFAGCDGITEIPVGMFTNSTSVTNLEYIFYKTGVKKLHKGTFEGLTGVKTVGAVFQDCVALEEIEAGTFDGLTAVKSFKYCFSGCESLRTIPEGLFAGLTTAYEFKSTFEDTPLESVPAGLFADARDYSSADLTYTFAGCKRLKTVPAGLFDKFTTVTSPGFQYTFCDSGLESVPEGLFANNKKVTTGFESTFDTCTSLTTIEGPIFPTATSVSTMAYTFADCTSLEVLPEGLFDGLGTSSTKYTATFYGCTSLKELPAGLFSANSGAKSFSDTFKGCSALTTIPADLLGTKEKVTTVKGMFDGCSSLTAIPESLFDGAPAITNFERTFAGCSSLTSIPAGLFSAIGTKTSSIVYSECFSKCSALESLPASLFDTVRRLTYIDGCFEGCTSLTGESPYTIITAEDGSEQKVHLYERTRGTDFLSVPGSASAYAKCFMDCTGLSDYDDIPTSWK